MIPENPTREDLREHYETAGNAPVECHENFGDETPEFHGGQWVTYDPDRGHFESIGTRHAADVGYDVDPEADAQYVYCSEAYLSDIITEDGNFTESALSTAKSLHRCQEDPAGVMADGRFTWFVAAFLDERREDYNRHGSSVYEGDYYDDVLDSVGVTPCED